MATTVEEIAVVMSARDGITTTMNNIDVATKKTTTTMNNFQRQAGQRVEMASAQMAQGAIMQLTGSIPGLNAVVLMFSATITKLMASLGPIGWALVGITVATTTLTSILRGASAAKKELADRGGALAGQYFNLAREIGMSSERGREMLKVSLQLTMAQLDQVRSEKLVLEAKQSREKLNEEETIQLLELTAKYETQKIALDKVRDSLLGVDEAKKRAGERVDEMDYDAHILAYEDYLKRKAEADEIAMGLSTEMEKMKLVNTGLILNQIEAQYMDTEKRLLELKKSGVDTSIAMESLRAMKQFEIQQAEAKRFQEIQKMKMEWQKETAKYFGSVAEALAAGDRVRTEQLVADLIIMWLDFQEKRLKAEMVVAGATLNFAKMATIAIGFGLLRGLVRGLAKPRVEMPEIPMPEIRGVEALGKAGGQLDDTLDRADEIGGRAIETAHQQIINYFTISPRFDMLDIEQLSEIRAKQIAEMLGKYIQEGIATGQVGLA